MRITIAAVGRAKRGPEQDLYDTYAERLSWPLTLKEVEEKRPLTGEARIARESELLLQAVPEGGVTVALDERGRNMTSTKL
ncbi:23S rRNA (pseudouridine(1915)-N(3))-methyltransferase RlmH, partial [Bacillus sp. SIMBA_161]